MLRIVQIIDSLKLGGAEKMLTVFAQEAAVRGIPLTVISLRAENDSAIQHTLRQLGVQLQIMPGNTLLAPARILRLAALLRQNRFQLAHTHLTTSNIIGNLAARIASIKVVSTLHSTKTDPRYYHPVRQNLETQLLRRASHRVVAVGESVAEVHRQRLRRKIDVIPNAISPISPLTYLERYSIRAKLCGNPENPIVISVGRLSPPKGYFTLIEAFRIVHSSHPTAKLIIVGSGILKDSLEQKIVELDLKDSVLLLGRRNDVAELLAASDVYVSASEWEGLPLSILEAMSAGLPIVATAVGEIPSIVSGEMGCLVPPSEPKSLAAAICKILDAPRMSLRAGLLARQYVADHHNSSKWMDRLLHLYDEVVQSALPGNAI